MTAVKRLLATLGVALAIVLGTGIPASAAFSDVARVSMVLETPRVQEPTSLSGRLDCGQPESVMSVSWAASSTPRVATYRVTLHFSDGQVQSQDVPATQTSWTERIPNEVLAERSFDVSVTAITDYGWYRQSSKQGQFHC